MTTPASSVFTLTESPLLPHGFNDGNKILLKIGPCTKVCRHERVPGNVSEHLRVRKELQGGSFWKFRVDTEKSGRKLI